MASITFSKHYSNLQMHNENLKPNSTTSQTKNISRIGHSRVSRNKVQSTHPQIKH